MVNKRHCFFWPFFVKDNLEKISAKRKDLWTKEVTSTDSFFIDKCRAFLGPSGLLKTKGITEKPLTLLCSNFQENI